MRAVPNPPPEPVGPTPFTEALAPLKAKMALPPGKLDPKHRGGRGNYAGSGYGIHSNAVRGGRAFVRSLGVDNPTEGLHFTTRKDADGTWSFHLLDQPATVLPMTAAPPQPQPVESPPMSPVPVSSPSAAAPRSPTGSDNRRILQAFEEHYDMEAQRYFKSFSDASLGEKLGCPRKWVTDIREQFDFGPDRNEAAEADAAELRSLKDQLAAAIETVLRVGAEAETVLARVKAKLDKIEGRKL